MSADFKSKNYIPYTVFQFENFSRPENHHYLWVMTDTEGNGKCIHVVAPDGALDFTYEVKDLRPEDSINVEDWKALGNISVNEFVKLLEICKDIPVPVKDAAGRSSAAVGDCRTWLDEAVDRLISEESWIYLESNFKHITA